MTDVDTIEIQVTLDPSIVVTGLRVRWESTNGNVVSVTPVQPAAGSSHEDTLVAQRRAVVRGVAAGRDTVRATSRLVPHSSAWEPHHAITVTQKWISVSAGDGHTCGVTVDSAAYCWGIGSSGALGIGLLASSSRPLRVINFGDLKFISVAAGDIDARRDSPPTRLLLGKRVARAAGKNDHWRAGSSRRSPYLVGTPFSP